MAMLSGCKSWRAWCIRRTNATFDRAVSGDSGVRSATVCTEAPDSQRERSNHENYLRIPPPSPSLGSTARIVLSGMGEDYKNPYQ